MIVGRYARILAALVLAAWICGTAAAQQDPWCRWR